MVLLLLLLGQSVVEGPVFWIQVVAQDWNLEVFVNGSSLFISTVNYSTLDCIIPFILQESARH